MKLTRLTSWSLCGGMVIALFSLPISANAAIATYTDQTSFLNAIASGSYYLNNFEGLQTGDLGIDSLAQSGGTPTFSYTIEATGDNPSTLYVLNDPGLPSGKAISTSDPEMNLVLSFTSGNVAAVGGTFFLTDFLDKMTNGSFTITLDSGTPQPITLSNPGDTAFVGFVTDNGTFSTLTFSGVTDLFSYASMDNLYVGTPVPEASTWLGAGFMVAVVAGRAGMRFWRRFRLNSP